jgi:O-methyltransferase
MKKIVLFGVGSGLRDVLAMLPKQLEVLCLSDNDKNKHHTDVMNYKILPPGELKNLMFDYVIITSRQVQEIKEGLTADGIPESKILFYYSSYDTKTLIDVNKNNEILSNELGFGLPRIGLATMYLWPESFMNNELIQDDFVRYMSINLIAAKFRQDRVDGNVAELGVYKGDLSVFLNALFPEKKLYLFDTFEGFAQKDVELEDQNNFSVSDSKDFNDTSLKFVMDRMPFPQNIIPRKGYFPESSEGVEDTFCFVSIDVDLYAPIVSGLDFFYPRLTNGGYIFVHDYNNVRYQGAKRGVNEFLERTGAKYFLLADFAGSIVITK